MENSTCNNSDNHDVDEVVISGISGRFPESDNVQEFKQNLLDGVDLITEDDRRWPRGIFGLPLGVGKLKNLKHFDAKFFGLHGKQVHTMDPQLRLLFESTFEAIVDAGVNPSEIRGSNTAVIVGTWDNETNEYWKRDLNSIPSQSIISSSRGMFGNRIAYAFDFKGPSYSVDSACSSSLVALQIAVTAIQKGECDAAIVAGTNVCLLPQLSVQMNLLGMLSSTSRCHSFDSSGNGYVRSEAVAALYIQKASAARRIYATVVGARTSTEGYKHEGFVHPTAAMQQKLIKELFLSIDANANDVVYVETHGTGTKVGDLEELNAIADFYCRYKKEPVLVGSVKSNMGHSESAAGVCSVTKAIIAMESGFVPQNLHFENPHPGIPSLFDGRIKVVTKNEPLPPGLIAINSFGMGGTNAHAVLRPHLKNKKIHPSATVPRLVTVSGRTENSVYHILQEAEKFKDDPEFFALLNKIHSTNIPGHEYRGYSIIGSNVKETNKIDTSVRRPIWFIYPGLGSQWCGMVEPLIGLDVFRDSIKRSAEVLAKEGIDLDEILSNKAGIEKAANGFVCILAVQIALTDLLRSLGIEPDGIVGHSIGELGCAYADNALTADQTIMAAAMRGISLSQAAIPCGMMAAVGLTWEECKQRCPPDVFPACHNSKDNVTVSGPCESVKQFVQQLQSENIFARVVNGSEYPFHSKYVEPTGPPLRAMLKKLIPNPKRRSEKWISSSVPEKDWKSSFAQVCSADYLANNTISPVFFYEAVQYIPENAITVEIAPHSLLQAVLKRTLSSTCTNVMMMNRNSPDGLQFLLSNLGKLFMAGCHPDISRIYPSVSFPVGRGTPMIAPLIQWDHSDEWDIPEFSKTDSDFGEVITVNLDKEENKYLYGHCIDERALFPAAAYLILVWKTLAKIRKEDYERMPIVFENVNFHRFTLLPKKGVLQFSVSIFKVSGDFEILENDVIVASGKVTTPDKVGQVFTSLPEFKPDTYDLTAEDVYKQMRLRGYDHSGLFLGIVESDTSAFGAKLKWNNNWIAYLDAMMQFYEFGEKGSALHYPTGIQKVVIDPQIHIQAVSKPSCRNLIPVNAYHNLGIVKSAGIEINKVTNTASQRRQILKKIPKLESYSFIPLQHQTNTTQEALSILLQIVVENSGEISKLKIVELTDEGCFSSDIKTIVDQELLVRLDYASISPKESYNNEAINATDVKKVTERIISSTKGSHLVVLSNVMKSSTSLQIATNTTARFLLLEEDELSDLKEYGFEVVSTQICVPVSKYYILLRKKTEQRADSYVLRVMNDNFKWVEKLKAAMNKSATDGTTIYLYSQGEPKNGLIGMVNCLRKEPGGECIRSYFLQNKNADLFTLSSPFYDRQVRKDLVHNVLSPNNTWGTYRHLPIVSTTETLQAEHAFVTTATIGDLSSFRWTQGPLSFYRPVEGKELCAIYYAPLNFKDVLLASGKLTPEREDFMGLEFSGRDSTGKRVMGMISGGGLATTCIVDPELLLEVPDQWSLEEAATIPAVYTTCYYALIVRGSMKPNESILIHAGAGGIGLAAISIALHMNCTVFTTVGSIAKREFLKKKFPKLLDENIGNSRDTSFEQLVLTRTKGRGVNLVLNSLAGEQLVASLRCLASEGRFLEIGKVDLVNNSPIGLSSILENRSISGIAIDEIIRSNTSEIKQINRLIKEGIKNGAVVPLPTMVFADSEVEQAVKLMASGKHIGKVVIKIREEEKSNRKFTPLPKTVLAAARTYMDPYKTYIVVGGLGGFGLELTNWLISRGATKIILTSRVGIKTGYKELCIKKWKECANVVVSKLDVVSFTDTRKLITEANALGLVGGIFNLAAVLHDALLQNQSEDAYTKVLQSKICTTNNLDLVSRELTPKLDYFVVFSSISSGWGIAGQFSYGYGNSAAERVCEARRDDGLPGLAIQWGPIGDVGIAMDLYKDNEATIAHLVPQRIHSCLATLDKILGFTHTIVTSRVWAEKFQEADTSTTETIAMAVCNLLGFKDTKSISQTSTLSELGMDSLVVTEIKQMLERNYDLVLSIQEIRALTVERMNRLGSTTHSTDEDKLLSDSDVVIQMSESTNTYPKHVFLIGANVSNWKKIVKNIEGNVYALQYTKNCPKESVTKLAQYYIEQIKTLQKKGPYIIIGYLFNACIAYEMGLQLNTQHDSTHIILVEGSHSYPANSFANFRNDIPRLQYKVSEYFGLQQQINSQPAHNGTPSETDPPIFHVLEKAISEASERSKSTVALLCDKIAASIQYKPSSKYEGDVTLIRTKNSSAELDDYGLSSVSRNQVEVCTLNGNNQNILEEPCIRQITKIVNTIINKTC